MDIGSALKTLRQQRGMTQRQLAARTELSTGFISQLENDAATPSLQTLAEILECLDSDMGSFFRDAAREQIVFRSQDMQMDEGDMASVVHLVPAGGRRMEPVRVLLPPGGHSRLEAPHSGEEFGVLLSGTVELTAGSRHEQLAAGDAFYFDAGVAHYVQNTADVPAELVWVTTPPNF